MKLWQELRRLRNGFFHYHARQDADTTLADAMAAAADEEGVYVIREPPRMRAEYADKVGSHIVHPFAESKRASELALELHGRITGLIGPLSNFLHQVEGAYLRSRPGGVVREVVPAELDFDATLAELTTMNGRPVTVSVGAADGSSPMTVVARGVLRSGAELSNESDPHPEETFFFALEDQIPTGFHLHRKPFRGAEWDGGILRVALGPLVLMVEPERES